MALHRLLSRYPQQVCALIFALRVTPRFALRVTPRFALRCALIFTPRLALISLSNGLEGSSVDYAWMT
jgi:hypothetical protein